jgi:nitrate reductase NapA
MDRRNFLKVLGVSTAVATPLGIVNDAQAEAETQSPGVQWDKAPCRYCGTGCGVEVGVQEGRIVAVRGDKAAPVNRGLLCTKGYHLPAMLYGKDRLKYPMRRTADGKSFERISWDDALDLIAEKFSNTLQESGPESVAVYGSGQWTVFDGYAALKWVKGGMRSNNIDPNARLCMASAVMGFMTQFQSDEPMGCYDDFELGDDFVLWGNNMAEMHPVLFSRILENKRKNPGVRIVDIATRRTPTTGFADLYLEIRPSTDLALANGIMHLLLAGGKIDEAFIEENVIFKRGLEAFGVDTRGWRVG